ncbi:hypothetical protein H4219_004404 [Mycoemilia scoparia]|uniref:Uncharacterized protein n=1 Tax=Mycoemilia scoparia TaxID=417184 RepID=A0A9W8DLI9_9FUNG|nr:hypothetical protein H4219_004404 [Mycoemilia scoparia]
MSTSSSFNNNSQDVLPPGSRLSIAAEDYRLVTNELEIIESDIMKYTDLVKQVQDEIEKYRERLYNFLESGENVDLRSLRITRSLRERIGIYEYTEQTYQSTILKLYDIREELCIILDGEATEEEEEEEVDEYGEDIEKSGRLENDIIGGQDEDENENENGDYEDVDAEYYFERIRSYKAE